MIVGAASLAMLFGIVRVLPRFPSGLMTLIAAGAVTALFRLDRHGIAILGPVPAGLPPLQLPTFPSDDIPSLLGSAAGLALVLFSSGMLSARSFGGSRDDRRRVAVFDRPLAIRPNSGIGRAACVRRAFAVRHANIARNLEN
jgi:MFS superfamily sulfate permease-like transporter